MLDALIVLFFFFRHWYLYDLKTAWAALIAAVIGVVHILEPVGIVYFTIFSSPWWAHFTTVVIGFIKSFFT